MPRRRARRAVSARPLTPEERAFLSQEDRDLIPDNPYPNPYRHFVDPDLIEDEDEDLGTPWYHVDHVVQRSPEPWLSDARQVEIARQVEAQIRSYRITYSDPERDAFAVLDEILNRNLRNTQEENDMPTTNHTTRLLRNHLSQVDRIREVEEIEQNAITTTPINRLEIEALMLRPIITEGEGSRTRDELKTMYSMTLRGAFNFFRRHHNGRYSDASLMQITRAADAEVDGGPRNELPSIALVTTPPKIDLDTEIKSGGTVAMGLQFPTKALICVHTNYRRQRIGRWLLNAMNGPLWVSRANEDGQIFLLRSGWRPSAMNTSGAIRYERGNGNNND